MEDTIKDNGGPAYPCEMDLYAGVTKPGSPLTAKVLKSGMTLRDYFAGQALAGYISHQLPDIDYVDYVSRECYEIADAMLKARNE